MAARWYANFFDRFYRALHAPYEEAYTEEEAFGALAFLDLPAGSSILDVPCGTGRHALIFAAQGFRVTGADLSAEAIALARRQAAAANLSIDWHVTDMRCLNWQDRFDAIVCLFNSFGYLGPEGDAAALAAMARALKPGGRLLLDLPNRDYYLGAVQEADWQETADHWVLTAFQFDLKTGIATTDYTFIPKAGEQRANRTVHRSARVRWYTYPELEALLVAAGLTVDATAGDWGGGPVGIQAPKLIVVARK